MGYEKYKVQNLLFAIYFLLHPLKRIYQLTRDSHHEEFGYKNIIMLPVLVFLFGFFIGLWKIIAQKHQKNNNVFTISLNLFQICFKVMCYRFR